MQNKGILRIISTPIGNIQDLSPRAAKALFDANIILVENITESRKLFNSLCMNLKNVKLIEYGSYNENKCIPSIIEYLKSGNTLAIISDAGTPTISDPGANIIKAIASANHKIEIIPGPSALIGALMGSGFCAKRFIYLGFLSRDKEQIHFLKQYRNFDGNIILFESPNRIKKTLDSLFNVFGAREIVVARELTKIHETFHRGILGKTLTPPLTEKGEIVVVINTLNQN